jgi:hypothetical protein
MFMIQANDTIAQLKILNVSGASLISNTRD